MGRTLGRPIGFMDVRNLNHPSMLSVKAAHHRLSLERSLLTTALAECKQKTVVAKITANSSRYAQPFYARHGVSSEKAKKPLPTASLPCPWPWTSVIPVTSPEPRFSLHRPNMRHFPVPSPSHP